MNKVVDVDITNKCTLKCSACASQNFDDPKMIPGGDTSIKDFQKILDYFDDVYLCGSYGDPIFNPNTIKFLKMAVSKKAKIAKLKKQKPGLYRNIALKKLGAGKTKKMRKPGTKGAPTAAAFKRAAKTAKA